MKVKNKNIVRLIIASLILLIVFTVVVSLFVFATVSHPASQITAGIFDSGAFTVNGSLNATGNSYFNDTLNIVNGSVGIGTDSPNEKLTVAGNVNATGNLSLGEKVIFVLGEVIDNVVDGFVKITGNLNVTGNVYSNNSMNVVDGNVGIGVDSPDSRFEVGAPNPRLVSNITSPNLGANKLYVHGKYAYVTGGSNLSIVDISNPSSPNVVGCISSTKYLGGANYVVVNGEYAYISTQGVDAPYKRDPIVIVNVSNPSNPNVVGNYSDNSNCDGGSLYLTGKYLYRGCMDDKIYIYNISDPANPTVTSTITDAYVEGHSRIFVQGRYAYAASSYNHSLVIFDVSDITNPTRVGQYTDDNYLNGAIGLYVSGALAYITADVSDSFVIINVSDPTNPVNLSQISSTSFLNSPREVYVYGKYAYTFGSQSDTFTIIDVSNSSSPTLSSATTKPNGDGGIFVLGKYAYITSNGNNEFLIYDISGVETPNINAGSIQTNSLHVTDNAQVANDMYVGSSVAIGKDAFVAGNIYAETRSGGAIDVAEWIKTNDDLEAGDVVVIDAENSEKVKISCQAYDTTVAGIISTKPHLTMGEEYKGDDAARLAIAGRVPVKATAENGAIKPGDVLTSSGLEGYAMKFTPLKFTGTETSEELAGKLNENRRRRNAILGKALEPLEEGYGKIMVLVALQ